MADFPSPCLIVVKWIWTVNPRHFLMCQRTCVIPAIFLISLWSVCQEDRLRELGLFSLERRFQGTQQEAFQYLKGDYKKEGDKLFNRIYCDRTGESSFKLRQGRFNLGKRNKVFFFFTARLVRLWNRLWAGCSSCRCPCSLQGSWIVFEGPFQFQWFYDSVFAFTAWTPLWTEYRMCVLSDQLHSSTWDLPFNWTPPILGCVVIEQELAFLNELTSLSLVRNHRCRCV